MYSVNACLPKILVQLSFIWTPPWLIEGEKYFCHYTSLRLYIVCIWRIFLIYIPKESLMPNPVDIDRVALEETFDRPSVPVPELVHSFLHLWTPMAEGFCQPKYYLNWFCFFRWDGVKNKRIQGNRFEAHSSGSRNCDVVDTRTVGPAWPGQRVWWSGG